MNKKIIIAVIIIILFAIGVIYLVTTEKHKYRQIAPHGVTAPPKAAPVSKMPNIITNKDVNPDGYDDESNY